jgi:hypothetical protein
MVLEVADRVMVGVEEEAAEVVMVGYERTLEAPSAQEQDEC